MALNKKKTNQILAAVLEEITPPKDDSTLKDINNFLSEAETEAKKLKIKAKPLLGGSFAKNTWLKGDYDVDVFFAFDLKYQKQNISELLKKILAKFNPEQIHGSRDYFHIKNKVCIEVIPVLNIKSSRDAQNVTDFSLWHVNWANKKGKKLKKDIRLAKKFCKSQRVYGAESYIRGFSGHVLDILVIHYKGFLPLIKAATRWKQKVIIDTENHYKGKALQYLNKSKTESPLVVVDPVQPGRNASAAISEEQFDKFISSAKSFVKTPSLKFFKPQQIDEAQLSKKGTLIKIKIEPLQGAENVTGVKLVRAGEYIKKALQPFEIIHTDWEWNKKDAAIFYFVIKKKELQKQFVVKGPPLKFKEHCERFRKAHEKTFTKTKNIYATITRQKTTPQEIIATTINDNYLKDKAKTIMQL